MSFILRVQREITAYFAFFCLSRLVLEISEFKMKVRTLLGTFRFQTCQTHTLYEKQSFLLFFPLVLWVKVWSLMTDARVYLFWMQGFLKSRDRAAVQQDDDCLGTVFMWPFVSKQDMPHPEGTTHTGKKEVVSQGKSHSTTAFLGVHIDSLHSEL